MNALRLLSFCFFVSVSIAATAARSESPAFQEAMRVQSTVDHGQGCQRLLACAESGDADCQGEVSRCLMQGNGLPRDPAAARKWAKSAADRNSPAGLRQLALFDYNGEGGPENLANALALGQRAADLGDARAMGLVGMIHRNGEGTPKDEAAGFRWLLKGAEAGDPYSQREVGVMLKTGAGTTADPKAAAQWLSTSVDNYRRLAELANLGAKNALAYAFEEGLGVSKDKTKAAELYRDAAESGLADAQRRYADMLARGQGVARDKAAALAWYRKAADLGDAWSQYEVGVATLLGDGVPSDPAAAYAWFEKAAPAVRNARYAMSWMRATGTGVPMDMAAAVRLYAPDYAVGESFHLTSLRRFATNQPTAALPLLFFVVIISLSYLGLATGPRRIRARTGTPEWRWPRVLRWQPIAENMIPLHPFSWATYTAIALLVVFLSIVSIGMWGELFAPPPVIGEAATWEAGLKSYFTWALGDPVAFAMLMFFIAAIPPMIWTAVALQLQWSRLITEPDGLHLGSALNDETVKWADWGDLVGYELKPAKKSIITTVPATLTFVRQDGKRLTITLQKGKEDWVIAMLQAHGVKEVSERAVRINL